MDAKFLLDTSLNVIDAMKNIFKATQELRWKVFLNSCKKQLRENGVLESSVEIKLIEYFSNKFAMQNAYDFVRRSIDANSEISRLALGRLYIRCASREIQFLDYDEKVLLNAYGSLEDRDVKLFLHVVDLISKLPRIDEAEGNLSTIEYFQMSRDEFDLHSEEFRSLQCSDYFELRDSMETFADLKIFKSTVGYLGAAGGGAFSLIKTKRFDSFLADLRWAKTNVG